jgi:hypothetical protein
VPAWGQNLAWYELAEIGLWTTIARAISSGMVACMTDDVPPLKRLEDMPPVLTQADLHQHWRALMGPLGFGRARLWLLFIGSDGMCDAPLVEVDELPLVPEQEIADNLLGICAQVLDEPGARVALLYARPGARHLTTGDRAWAAALTRAAENQQVPMWPVHLANDEEIRVITADDMAESA